MKDVPLSRTQALPFACLFLSGTASLVYQLVWIRQLSLVFGTTLYAISAVLCAFMAGLALGAAGSARGLRWAARSGRTINLIFLYGVMEGLIGLYGLAFPWLLKLLEGFYPLLIGDALDAGTGLHLTQFFLAAGLMLPPTLLMGATLPVFGSWVIGGRTGTLFSSVSVLYSLNTFGAVVGCLYTQWFAIETFGTQGTLLTAVALNLLIFVCCLPYRRLPQTRIPAAPNGHLEPVAPETGPAAPEPAPGRGLSLWLLLLFVFSGLASLSNEILWTRALVFPLGTTLYSFALILATFLFCIALGSLISERLLGSSALVKKFLLLELGIGAACLAVLPLFEYLPEWTSQADRWFYDLENTPARTLAVRSLFAFGLMFLPALGFGLLFPLANRIHLSLFGSVSDTLANSYALNTLGAVAGTILTPFVFIPAFGIRTSLEILAIGLMGLATVGLVWQSEKRGPRLAGAVALAGVLALAGYRLALAPTEKSASPLAPGRLEVNVPKERIRVLEYKEGSFATLSVVEDIESGNRTLYVNGFSTATVSPAFGGSTYMQAMGFVPMALHPDPKRALVIGFGTGNTLGTVSLFPGVQADGVEIDAEVLSLAPWFSRWNHNVLKRPRVRTIVQDGRIYTRWTENRYDVITLEPMSPVQAGVVHLYTRDFYEQARSRLQPGGLLMQWLPLHLVGGEDARAIIRSFQEVFPQVSVWNSFLTRIVLLVGSETPVALDRKRFNALMQTPVLKREAERMGVRSFLDLADFFITRGGPLEASLREAPIITDDRPILEFSPVTLLPPLKWQTDETFLNLLRHRVGQAPPLAGVSPEEKTRLEREFQTRTAQRFAVFSRRYEGPGQSAFARKHLLAGLEAVDRHLLQLGDTPIRLDGARWQMKSP